MDFEKLKMDDIEKRCTRSSVSSTEYRVAFDLRCLVPRDLGNTPVASCVAGGMLLLWKQSPQFSFAVCSALE